MEGGKACLLLPIQREAINSNVEVLVNQSMMIDHASIYEHGISEYRVVYKFEEDDFVFWFISGNLGACNCWIEMGWNGIQV